MAPEVLLNVITANTNICLGTAIADQCLPSTGTGCDHSPAIYCLYTTGEFCLESVVWERSLMYGPINMHIPNTLGLSICHVVNRERNLLLEKEHSMKFYDYRN